MSIRIIKTEIFKNLKGSVIKIISKKNNHTKKVKEVYISRVSKNYKDWRMHKKMNCLLLVLKRKIEFQWNENNKIKKKIINSNLKNLILIKARTNFRFKGLNRDNFMINFSDQFYDNKEIIRNSINIK